MACLGKTSRPRSAASTWRSLVLALSLALLALGTYGRFSGRSVEAAELGFKWFNNSWSYENVSVASAGNWTSAVQSGASAWYSNTELWVNTDSGASYYEIVAIAYPPDPYSPAAWTSVYSNNYTCLGGFPPVSPPGNCNKTTEPASFAYLEFNDLYYEGDSSDTVVTTHELGHVFGLAHGSCSDNTIMEDGSCWPHPSSITSADIANMNALY